MNYPNATNNLQRFRRFVWCFDAESNKIIVADSIHSGMAKVGYYNADEYRIDQALQHFAYEADEDIRILKQGALKQI